MATSFAGKLLRVLVGTLMGLLLAEAALRLIDFPHTLPYFHERDNDLGVALRPGARGRFRGEGIAFVRVNREGFRGPEYSRAKPPGTLRIAVLGDSMTAAMSVEENQTFSSVLERELSSCPALHGLKPQVLNFGVNGYGTAQELLMLRTRVWQYSPDLVILAVTTGNDIRNNFRQLEGNPYVPYFVDDDGKLALDDSFRQQSWVRAQSEPSRRALEWVRNHSRVVELIFDVRGAVFGIHRPEGDVRGEAGLDNEVYKDPTEPTWQQAWRVIEDIITTMDSEVKQHGARFLLVTLSSGIQVYPDPQARARFMAQLGLHDLYYPENRLHQLAEHDGFPVLNLAPLFQQYADAHKTYLHGFAATHTLGTGHWNVEGNRLAGELIAQKVCNNVL